MKNEKIVQELKDRIQKKLAQGRDKLTWLESRIAGEKNGQKLKSELGKAGEKLVKLKETFSRYEEKVVRYTEKNPKKALAIAGAAGLLAASLWNSFQKKKTTAPKPAPKTEKKKKDKK